MTDITSGDTTAITAPGGATGPEARTGLAGKAQQAIGTVRDTVRETAGDAIDVARARAANAARATAETLEGNPLSVIVGGLAVGVLAGALLPHTEREAAALRPIGRRIAQGAGAAIKAAREVGMAELAAAGISSDAARNQVKKLIGSVVDAAKSAGDAAAKAARANADKEAAAASDASTALPAPPL